MHSPGLSIAKEWVALALIFHARWRHREVLVHEDLWLRRLAGLRRTRKQSVWLTASLTVSLTVIHEYFGFASREAAIGERRQENCAP